MKFEPGQMIRFTYTHKAVDLHTGDKFKEVLVLADRYLGKVHGIDLNRISPAERDVLEQILDPELKDTPSRIPLINDIKRRMDPLEDIKNPVTFYNKFVKLFLQGKDAYRTYFPNLMTSVTIIKDVGISGHKKVKNPLFGQRPNPKTDTEKPQALTPIDIMAQNAKDRGDK